MLRNSRCGNQEAESHLASLMPMRLQIVARGKGATRELPGFQKFDLTNLAASQTREGSGCDMGYL